MTDDFAVGGVVEVDGFAAGSYLWFEECEEVAGGGLVGRGLSVALGGVDKSESITAIPAEGEGSGAACPPAFHVDVFTFAGKLHDEFPEELVEIFEGRLGEGRHESGGGIVVIEDEDVGADIAVAADGDEAVVGVGAPVAYFQDLVRIYAAFAEGVAGAEVAVWTVDEAGEPVALGELGLAAVDPGEGGAEERILLLVGAGKGACEVGDRGLLAGRGLHA